MSYTKEKWVLAKKNKYEYIVFRERVGDAVLANIENEFCTEQEAKANAYLIVAAPKTKRQRDALLGACKKYINWLEDAGKWRGGKAISRHDRMVAEMRQAIAEADNETV